MVLLCVAPPFVGALASLAAPVVVVAAALVEVRPVLRFPTPFYLLPCPIGVLCRYSLLRWRCDYCCCRCCCRCRPRLILCTFTGALLSNEPQSSTRPTTRSLALNHHQHPFLSRQTNILGISPKPFRFTVTCNSMSPVAILALLMRTFTSFTWPYFEKKVPILSSQISTSTPWIVTFILQVPIYSVCSFKVLVFNTHPAKSFACFSVGRRISHRAFVLLANTLRLMSKVFKASSRLTPINFRVLTSKVSRDIMQVFTASRASGMVRNSLPLNESSNYPL